jgi:hypothetical protein
MMYSPYPPWARWYGPWAPPPMHFHPGWLGPAEGFQHGIYYIGDDRYGSVDHQQDRRSPSQENRMVWNPKLDGPVSLKIVVVPNQQQKLWVPKDRSPTNGSGGSQG